MATIAGRRTTRPRPVGTLVNVPSSSTNTALRRSGRRFDNQSSPSLRVSFLAASASGAASDSGEQRFQALKSQPQHGALAQAQNHSLTPTSTMYNVHSYERLSSSPSSSSSVASVPPNHALTGQQCALAETQSGSNTPWKAPCDKALPSKPVLRGEDSPERRGVVDATDFIAKSLDDRFPPLEPVSASESINSDDRSPSGNSFEITNSLLPASGPDSIGPVQVGVATNVSTTPVKTMPKVKNENNDNYILNAPGSGDPQIHNSLLKNDHGNNDSPSRLPRRPSSVKRNRSFLRGRQAMSVRGRQSLALIGANDDGAQGSLEQNDLPSTGNQSRQNLFDGVVQGTERSSKYGYNIRESFEAREVIMGKPGPSKVDQGQDGNERSIGTRALAGRNGQPRELRLQLATPPPEKQMQKLNEDINADYVHLSSSDEMEDVAETRNHGKPSEYLPKNNSLAASRIGHPASLRKPPTRIPPHPPRTSSLSAMTSPLEASTSFKANVSPGLQARRPPVPIAQVYGVTASNTAKEAPQASRTSLFYRQTTASASRASFISKKMTDVPSSTSRLPHSKTLSSLSDVGKGMKKLSKKVGKIIPGRRGVAVEAVAEEILATTAYIKSVPSRQLSRLLTTYHDSGMENTYANNNMDRLATASGSFFETEPEPEDVHDTMDIDEDNTTGNNASHNVAGIASGQLTFFGPGDPQGGNNGSGDDPPRLSHDQHGQGGHYVEYTGGESSNGNAEVSNGGSSTDDYYAEASRPLLSPTGTAVGAYDSDFLMSNTYFDHLASETDLQVRELIAFAQTLNESPLRTLMFETASQLSEGLIKIRQARIQATRIGLLIDEMAVLIADKSSRLADMMRPTTAHN